CNRPRRRPLPRTPSSTTPGRNRTASSVTAHGTTSRRRYTLTSTRLHVYTSTRLHVYTSDLLARLEHIDGDCHVAPFVGLKGAHADDLARDFLAAIVANRNDDGVFPWGIGFRVPEVALDSQCGECRLCASFGDRLRVE